MSIMEVACFVLVGVLALAYVVRILISLWQLLYKCAPVVVPLIIIALFLTLTGNLDLSGKGTVDDARHTESVENQSDSGERSE